MSPTLRGTRRSIPHGVPESEIRHFESVPIARTTLEDPYFHIFKMSRTITHGGRGHTLMAGTWNTEDTVAHLLSLYREPSSVHTSDQPHRLGDVQTRAEVRRFYTFGSGLNAHPDLLHGGVIACILDSTMGNVIGMAIPEIANDRNGNTFTAQLNVSYKSPVRTPGTIMARSWIKRVEEGGRKVWVEGVIEGGKNGELSHARAEGLWIRVMKKGKGGRL